MSDSGISWDLMEEEFYKGKRIVGLMGGDFDFDVIRKYCTRRQEGGPTGIDFADSLIK